MNHEVSICEVLHMVGTQDACFTPQQSHNALVVQVVGYMGVDCRQRVVQQEQVFILCRNKAGINLSCDFVHLSI